jgi:hypothetical protein
VTKNVYKMGPSFPITLEVFDDSLSARSVQSWFDDAARRVMCPWEFPDRNPIPEMVLVPWLARWMDKQSDIRARVSYALRVLRFGVPNEEDYWA